MIANEVLIIMPPLLCASSDSTYYDALRTKPIGCVSQTTPFLRICYLPWPTVTILLVSSPKNLYYQLIYDHLPNQMLFYET